MAGFCTRCGRPLPESGICPCTQQAEPGQREGKTVKQIHEISSRISKNNRAILRRNFRRDANRNHFIIVYHSLPSAASPRTRRIKNGLVGL